jgi:hypothetical protein
MIPRSRPEPRTLRAGFADGVGLDEGSFTPKPLVIGEDEPTGLSGGAAGCGHAGVVYGVQGGVFAVWTIGGEGVTAQALEEAYEAVSYEPCEPDLDLAGAVIADRELEKSRARRAPRGRRAS